MLRPELLTSLVLFVSVHAELRQQQPLASQGVLHVRQVRHPSGNVTGRHDTVTDSPGIVTAWPGTVTDIQGIVTGLPGNVKQGMVTGWSGIVTDGQGTVTIKHGTVTATPGTGTDEQTDRRQSDAQDADSIGTGYSHRHVSFQAQSFTDRSKNIPANRQSHLAHHGHFAPHHTQHSTLHTHFAPHPTPLIDKRREEDLVPPFKIRLDTDSSHHSRLAEDSSHHIRKARNNRHHTRLAKDSSPHTGKTKDSGHHTRKAKDSSLHTEKAKDSSLHIEKAKDSSLHTEKAEDSSHLTRKAKDSGHHTGQYVSTQASSSQHQASPRTDNWLTEDSSTVQPVTEDSRIVQSVTKDSSIVQPVTEDSSTVQPVAEDSSAVTTPASQDVRTDMDTSDKLQRLTQVAVKRGSAVTSQDDANSLSSLLRDSFLNQNPTLTARQVTTDSTGTQTVLSLLSPPSLPSWPENSAAPAPLKTVGPWGQTQDANVDTVHKLAKRPGNDQGINGDSAISVEQRSWRCSLPNVLVGEEDLPWTCQQHFAWRHLGEHVYPSHMYEAVCEGSTCWYGHFNCTPITYTVHVLQVCLRSCQDQRVPSPLRSRWQWTDLNITVGCQCVR